VPLFPGLGKAIASPRVYVSYLLRFAMLPLVAPFAGVHAGAAEAVYLSRYMLPDALRRWR